MPPLPHTRPASSILVLSLLVAALLGGCGNKGDLYRDAPAAVVAEDVDDEDEDDPER